MDYGLTKKFIKIKYIFRGFSVRCVTCPGATDIRYVRRQGVPGISFSPLMDTPMLLHAHNERIHVDVFKTGIDVMEKVVEAVANYV